MPAVTRTADPIGTTEREASTARITYTSVDGRVLDLSQLGAPERGYLEMAAQQYEADVPWAEFCQLTYSAANPVIVQGRATAKTVESPLFLGLLDMEWRLGVRQGFLTSTAPTVADDPFADEWLLVGEAASILGVTRAAVYQAVERGTLISHGARPARISANSLKGWLVNAVRKRSGSMTKLGHLKAAAV